MLFHNINPVLLEIGPFQIRYYGLFYALGFVIAYFMISYLAKRKQLSITKDDVADLIVYAILGVVLGARLAYVVFLQPCFLSAKSSRNICSLARRLELSWRVDWSNNCSLHILQEEEN